MQCPKRPLEDQDPDYPELQPSDSKRQKLAIDKAREGTCQKIRRIINSQFEYEMKKREEQLVECQDRLYKARQNLRLLRYAVVSSYYRAQPSKEQTRIHPAIKKLLGSKKESELVIDLDVPESMVAASSQVQPVVVDEEMAPKEIVLSKQPRYIAPNARPGQEPASPPRAANMKVKRRIVVGNVSKWIHQDFRDDASTHKWMIYVRGPPEAPDVSKLVERVRFFLHSSYKPHDVIEIKESPFHLSRRGWGEFPVRVQVHFLNPQNRPIDVIHQLVLDKTYTGLQTLGGETVVDAWIVENSSVLDRRVEALSNSQNASPEKMNVTIDEGVNIVIKEEPPSTPTAIPPVSPGKSLLKCNNTDVAPPLNGIKPSPIKVKTTELLRTAEKKVIKLVISPDGQFSTSNLGKKIIIRPNVVTKASPVSNAKTLLTFGAKSVIQLQKKTAPQVLRLADGKTSLSSLLGTTSGGQKPVVYLKMNSEGKLVPVVAPSGQPKIIKFNSATPPPLVLIKKNSLKNGSNGQIIVGPSLSLNKKIDLKSIQPEKKAIYKAELELLKVRCADSLDVSAMMLMKKLPLISSELAQDSDYRTLHPYVVASREIFLSIPTGKQRALEITRAKEISGFLKKQGFDVHNPWEIVRLSVAYGFTPMPDLNLTVTNTPGPLSNNNGARYSEANSIQSWLQTQSNSRVQGDTVIDVEGSQSPNRKVKSTAEDTKTQLMDETLPEQISNCNFIRQVTRKIGIQMEPEQLTGSTVFRGSEIVLYQAAMQLAEDIIRRSHSSALSKHKRVSSIELSDVRGALQQRSEFDIFSNEGLGMDFDK